MINKIILNVSNKVSLNREVLEMADKIVFSPEVYTEKTVSEFLSYTKKLKPDAKIYLGLPVTANNQDIALLRNIIKSCRPDGVLAENLYGIALADEFGLPFIAGTGLNIYNSKSANYFLSQGGDFIYSAELNLKEIEEIEKKTDGKGFVFIHGDMRAMTLNHCPAQVVSGKGCDACMYTDGLVYEDKKGYRFPLRRVKLSKCCFELYNSAKLSAVKKLDEREINSYFVLLGLPASRIYDIIKTYTEGKAFERNSSEIYTTGHLFKGVN